MEERLDERAVWSRVTAGARSGGGDSGPIGPELLAALERKQAEGLALRQLGGRLGTEAQRSLRQLLQQQRQQERTLAALYFFLTGQRPCLSAPGETPRREDAADALRRMLQTLELSAGRLEALAARSTGEAQAALLELTRQDRQRFHQLLALLGARLDGHSG